MAKLVNPLSTPGSTFMNNTFYYIFKDEEEVALLYLNESDEDAQEMCEAEELSSWEKVVVNSEHYFTAYSFYNDDTDFEDEISYEATDFNSLEHANTYIDSNDGGGHHQWVRTEEKLKGRVVRTYIHSNIDGYIWHPGSDIPGVEL